MLNVKTRSGGSFTKQYLHQFFGFKFLFRRLQHDYAESLLQKVERLNSSLGDCNAVDPVGCCVFSFV